MNRDFKPPAPAPATTFGWLRRPEKDTPTADAWERPDGKLYLHAPRGTVPLLVRMPRRSRSE